jgi:transcription-repair coupling factor (superfamily II helicase)
MRMRNLAKSFGVEKITLKKEKLVLFFVSDIESPFYSSEIFSNFLAYVQANPKQCALKQNESKLYLTIAKVSKIDEVITILKSAQNIKD